jgi:hypothetical protein
MFEDVPVLRFVMKLIIGMRTKQLRDLSQVRIPRGNTPPIQPEA